MTDKENNVSTPHNNFVVVSQDDKNHLPSSAKASPQIGLVQSSAIGEQNTSNDVLCEENIILLQSNMFMKMMF